MTASPFAPPVRRIGPSNATARLLPGEAEQLTQEEGEEEGWQAVFGNADKEDMAELQRFIDEHHVLDPEAWDLPDLDRPS